MIDFYTASTPNGYKVAIMLEECALPYSVHSINLSALEQKSPWFLAINPNGRIPAIVDQEKGGFAVFESGAILIYLAESTGKFLPPDPLSRSRVMQWVMWQMAGLGPMIGQLNVFRHYFPERLPAVIERYERESYRLFEVLEQVLSTRAHVAGEDYTIADIACWPWVYTHAWAGLDLSRFPVLKGWFDRVAERPAIRRALTALPNSTPASEQAYADIVKATRKTLA